MFKNKNVWFILTIISFLSFFTAFKLFPRAFPILNIDLNMSKEDALLKSTELSKIFNIGPNNVYQAATFGVDSQAQNFIELDQGGSQKFIEVLNEKYYEAYTWKVRHYFPDEINEAIFIFTPTGEPYGFKETIPEETYINSLSQKSALSLAESYATDNWNVDLSVYNLIEKKQDKKTSNRLDHTFVYKRNDINLGEEGEYRLKIVISGNKLTHLERYIEIPETFDRKYEEMRSANNTISTVATYGLYVFCLGGLVVGLFLLNRERWLIWKPAIYFGLFVSLLTTLSYLNDFSLSWFDYDTAISTQTHLIRGITMSVLNFFIMAFYLILTFTAAESLTRKAFPQHPRLWNTWSTSEASSLQITGRTIAGYMMIALDLLFVICFYSIAVNYFGWWVPAGTLSDPNTVATPIPWITAIGRSLHAGFWEECLFRAIPLAGAILIGKKYGNKKIWLYSAMILQALIFAGAHANYPSYPAYSRLIELIVPSLFWGYIYLQFGLIPVIISHFGYDVVWFAMPIFASNSSNVTFDKIMVILLLLTPIWFILKSYIKVGRFTQLKESGFNNSFHPSKVDVSSEDKFVDSKPLELHKYYKYILSAFTLIGVLYLFFPQSKDYFNNKITVSRTEAMQIASDYLDDNNISLDNNWTVITKLYTGKINAEDQFIWETQNKEIYGQMIGQYLEAYMWKVRYVRFNGTEDEKAEEYAVIINNDGSFVNIEHKIPENRLGQDVSEANAKILAENYINKVYNIEKNSLSLVSVEPVSLPNRTDWVYVFSINPSDYNLLEGDLRSKVTISDGKISSSNRYVHVPEEWERGYKNSRSMHFLFSMSFFLIIIFYLYAMVSSFGKWSKKKFDFNIYKILSGVLMFSGAVYLIISYPHTIQDYSTAKPYINQSITSIGLGIVAISFFGLCLPTLFGHVFNNAQKSFYTFKNYEIILLSLGFVGVTGYILNVEQLTPLWSTNELTNTYFPVFANFYELLYNYIAETGIILFAIYLLNHLTDYGRKKHYIYIGLIFLLTFATHASELGHFTGIETISQLSIITIFSTIFYVFIYKYFFVYDITLILLFNAILVVFNILPNTLNSQFPGSLISAVLSSIFILALGYYLRNYFINKIRLNG